MDNSSPRKVGPRVEIREEVSDDVDAIRTITDAAFKNREYSNGQESQIIDRLRKAGALTMSLVAVDNGEVIGHIAFSPVIVDSMQQGWYGLGPVSVRPDWQGRGFGSALIREGLARLTGVDAKGCVLLGAPAFYRRFGFEHSSDLWYEQAPAEHFMVLPLNGSTLSGRVSFHQAFSTA